MRTGFVVKYHYWDDGKPIPKISLIYFLGEISIDKVKILVAEQDSDIMYLFRKKDGVMPDYRIDILDITPFAVSSFK